MKVGDLVKYTWPDSFNDYARMSGIVVESRQYSHPLLDGGKPGVEIIVHWENGTIETFDESEIEIIEIV